MKKKTLTNAKKKSMINSLEKAMGKLVDAGFQIDGSAGTALQDAQRNLRAAIDKIESL